MSISRKLLRFPFPFTRRAKPKPGESITFGRRRVYILPTRHGFGFVLCLLMLLIGSINYENNLGYMLTFLLTSLGLVAMVHTWRNLLGLSILAGHSESVFAGQEACFPMFVSERDQRPRYAVRISAQHTAGLVVDLAAGATSKLLIHTQTERRGAFEPGSITLSTVYPLGLFRAWCFADTGISCLVYPAPATSGEPPTEIVSGGRECGDNGEGTDDFIGLRPYHEGDSLKHIAWKVLARERGLFTKQFGGSVTQRISLDWDLLPGLDTEQRLSLLCRFILLAEEHLQHYQLRLPTRVIPENGGEQHKHLCLAELARFRQGSTT